MLIAAALLALPLLSLFAIVTGRKDWSHGVVYAGAFLSSVALISAGLEHLGGHNGAPSVVLPFGLPWLHAHFRVDNLSALFLLIINVPAAAASAFGVGYSDHLPERRRVTPFYPMFLFGMNSVLVADDAFMFLVAWEFMSLASWLMVLADHEKAENRRAGMVYLTMATFGTFCLLPCFGLMAGHGGDYTFAAMRAHELSPWAGSLVVLLVLLGAGSKAGLIPLHAWLPLAHPAAPSHVSALMSGVMTKVALYGLIRVLFDLHGDVGWQWGATMMVVGGITAVMGVLYAVLQDDIKKLLAYSTVENIGVAVIGLGLAIAFKAAGTRELAALALVAGLYHMLNHAIFKTLLFLGAGAVITATGERSLGALGGLLKRMPWTGATFLVGAAAISALPPLNGFVSEWLVLQALFKGPEIPHWAMKFGVPVVCAFLALAAALAATCFVRAFGIAFLGRPRSAAAAEAGEVSFGMRWSMVALAALCVILGVIPVTVTDHLSAVVQPLTGVQFAVSSDLGWPFLSPVSNTRGSYSGTVLVMVGLALFGFAILLVHRFGTIAMRAAPAWDCGHNEDIPNSQYTGQSFSQPLRRSFAHTIFRARETVVMPEPGDDSPARHQVHMIDPIWVGLYERLGRIVGAIADQVNRLQYLTVRRYLLMMFCTLVFMLLVVAVRQQQ
ncbi:MAG: hydrogenase 4 subunit B [Rhodospirillaceae bacterium]|nr:hydrogenase 4 subunit B [Rhodospirillales bacterium]